MHLSQLDAEVLLISALLFLAFARTLNILELIADTQEEIRKTLVGMNKAVHFLRM
jgi:hypothetical protein